VRLLGLAIFELPVGLQWLPAMRELAFGSASRGECCLRKERDVSAEIWIRFGACSCRQPCSTCKLLLMRGQLVGNVNIMISPHKCLPFVPVTCHDLSQLTEAYVNSCPIPSRLAKSLLPACCVTADFKEIEPAQEALTYRRALVA